APGVAGRTGHRPHPCAGAGGGRSRTRRTADAQAVWQRGRRGGARGVAAGDDRRRTGPTRVGCARGELDAAARGLSRRRGRIRRRRPRRCERMAAALVPGAPSRRTGGFVDRRVATESVAEPATTNLFRKCKAGDVPKYSVRRPLARNSDTKRAFLWAAW